MKIEQDRAGDWSAYWDDHLGRPRRIHGFPSAIEARRAAKTIRDAEASAAGVADLPPAILRYFDYSHLPEPLRTTAQPFADLAKRVWERLPPSAERAVALRKLLEAKDAAVRAALP